MSISRRRTPPWAAAVFVLLAWSSALCSTHAADGKYPISASSHGVRDLPATEADSPANELFLPNVELWHPSEESSWVQMEQFGSPLQDQSTQSIDLSQGTTTLKGATLKISEGVEGGRRTLLVAVFLKGSPVGIFKLGAVTPEKRDILLDLAEMADKPNAIFDVIWTAKTATSGQLKISHESEYSADATSPTINFTLNYSHGVNKNIQVERISASILKDDAKGIKNLQQLKDLLVKSANPPLLKTGAAFRILRLATGPKKAKNEVKDENLMTRWVLGLAAQPEPLIAVEGDLERNVIIELPSLTLLTWPNLLKLHGFVVDATKSGTGLKKTSAGDPSVSVHEFAVPSDWLAMSPDEQFKLWTQGTGPKLPGVDPRQFNLQGLFTPHHGIQNIPFIFVNFDGQPFGEAKRPEASFVGSRSAPVSTLPDFLQGLYIPLVWTTFYFPGGGTFKTQLSPTRKWADIQNSYKNIRKQFAPKEKETEGIILRVRVNGHDHAITPEFLSKYPTLLHLLAYLGAQDASFKLDDLSIHFGASAPKKLTTHFIMESPAGVEAWCHFQLDIPVTKKGTVLIKPLLKKARRMAESPKGCNILNARGLRFEKFTAVADVKSITPIIQVENRRALNFSGTSEECKHLGSIFLEAYKNMKSLALYFSATHLLKTEVHIPVSKGKEKVKTVTARVHMGEPFPEMLKDFSPSFEKAKVPVFEFPYIHIKGKPPSNAMPHGYLPSTWYTTRPRGVKMEWYPKMPTMSPKDVFIDGRGSHPAGGSLNVPLTTGGSPLPPVLFIEDFLRRHIPKLNLPIPFEFMSPEDKSQLLRKFIIELDNGRTTNMAEVLQPILGKPNWKAFNPQDLKLPEEFLKSKVKKMWLEGDIDIITTDPTGGQKTYTVTTRPQQTWGHTLTQFYQAHPDIDPSTLKLYAFDRTGEPLSHLNEESDSYTGSPIVVQQRKRGLEVHLRTPLGNFKTCFYEDVATKDCIVVPMHTIFCGRINGYSDRARLWQTMCTAEKIRSLPEEQVQRLLDENLISSDVVRPRHVRDAITVIRKFVTKAHPDVVSQLNIPDPERSAGIIAQLQKEIEELRAKPSKTADDYDLIQSKRREIKKELSKETKWAAAESITFYTVDERGQEKEIEVSLIPNNIRASDGMWKLYHLATQLNPQARGLSFDNVFKINLRAMTSEERAEEMKRLKRVEKEKVEKQKAEQQVKVAVRVAFYSNDKRVVLDNPITIQMPNTFLQGLSHGAKRLVVKQLAKIYNIPRKYFTLKYYPFVVIDSATDKVPILAVELKAECMRSDGKIGVPPKELYTTLKEQGGFDDEDTVNATFVNGEAYQVKIRLLKEIPPEKVKLFAFAWKRSASATAVAAEEMKKKKKERAEGEIASPKEWTRILVPWLARMRNFASEESTSIKLTVHADSHPDPRLRKSNCTIRTFGELLPYINNIEKLLDACPGLQGAVSMNSPFIIQLGVGSSPPLGFRLYNRSPPSPTINMSYLERLAHLLNMLGDDAVVAWSFQKQSGTMTSQQVHAVRGLLNSDAAKDAALVREILKILQVPSDDIERIAGRLRLMVSRDIPDSAKVLLLTIERLGGAKIHQKISAKGNPETLLGLDVPPGEYGLMYTLYSQQRQVNGQSCSTRNSQEFKDLSWKGLLEWCGLTFEELSSLKTPFVWIEGTQLDMYPRTQPGIPIVTFESGKPTAFTFQRPGESFSSILPGDVFYNSLMRPGGNTPGATFIGRSPGPDNNIDLRVNYFAPDPSQWGSSMKPSLTPTVPGSWGEINILPDISQQETGRAFAKPYTQAFKIPGFQNLPGLQKTFQLELQRPGGLGAPKKEEVVYLQAPGGTGRYYLCAGVTAQELLSIRDIKRIAEICNIPDIGLLNTDCFVFTADKAKIPNYSASQDAVPLIVLDRSFTSHSYKVEWNARPSDVMLPFLKGNPEDLIIFHLANTNSCPLSQATLAGFKSWDELTRFCSSSFQGIRPSLILAQIQPVFKLPPIQIDMPEQLRKFMTQQHNGRTPETVLSNEPLDSVLLTLTSSTPPGTTLHIELVMRDGSVVDYGLIPDNWKNIPASQIPGISVIKIRTFPSPQGHTGDTNLGTLKSLLEQFGLPETSTYSDLLNKLKAQQRGPSGLRIPSTEYYFGGPPPPGQEKPVIDIELSSPERFDASGKPTSFGARFPLEHGSLPENVPLNVILERLHNPSLIATQRPKAEYSITTTSGSYLPHVEVTNKLDAGFGSSVEWLRSKVAVPDSLLRITVVVDGIPLQGTLNPPMLLGHNIASVISLAGVGDPLTNHSIVIIGQPAAGHEAPKAPASQGINIVVNGKPLEAGPGPLNFADLLNIQVPRQGQGPHNFRFNLRGPSGTSVTQIVPSDLLPFIQQLSDDHDNAGLPLLLSFLNSLSHLSKLAPGETIYIDTSKSEEPLQPPAGDLRSQIEKLLDTPASTAPVGAYIKAVTGEGPNQKVVNIPILEGDKNSTIRRILEHLRLTLPKITDIKLIPHAKGSLNIRSGSLDFNGPTGGIAHIPLQRIDSTNTETVSNALLRIGLQLRNLLEGVNVANMTLGIKGVFTKSDGTSTTAEVPLGTGEEALNKLKSVTFWQLLPEEVLGQDITNISMTLTATPVTAPPPAANLGARPKATAPPTIPVPIVSTGSRAGVGSVKLEAQPTPLFTAPTVPTVKLTKTGPREAPQARKVEFGFGTPSAPSSKPGPSTQGSAKGTPSFLQSTSLLGRVRRRYNQKH